LRETRALDLQASPCRVIPMSGPIDPAALRTVYAAATFCVVGGVAGVATENGLVMDAVKLGVPLVMSDNDLDLVRRLAGAPWVTTFNAGSRRVSRRWWTDSTFRCPCPRSPRRHRSAC
jgi:hypothetical protein